MQFPEVISVGWTQVDMSAMTVRTDATKSGEPLEFPVARLLAAILERRFAERDRTSGMA